MAYRGRMKTLLAVVCTLALLVSIQLAHAPCPDCDHGCHVQHCVYQCGVPQKAEPGSGVPANPALCVDGYCLETTITSKAAGTVCTDDGNACTADYCDGANACIHRASTDPCAADDNACTSDVCSGGACTHTNSTGGKVCGRSCIAQASCCSRTDCGGGHACSGVGGSCGCPGGTYDFNGTCISTANC